MRGSGPVRGVLPERGRLLPARGPKEGRMIEIMAESGKQFDPVVVDAFRDREHVLHEIRREFLAAA